MFSHFTSFNQYQSPLILWSILIIKQKLIFNILKITSTTSLHRFLYLFLLFENALIRNKYIHYKIKYEDFKTQALQIVTIKKSQWNNIR